MVDVVITDTHLTTDHGGWVGDDLNIERVNSTDGLSYSVEFLPFHVRTITDDISSTDSGGWESPGFGEGTGFTDSAGVEQRNLEVVVTDQAAFTDEASSDVQEVNDLTRTITDISTATDSGQWGDERPTESAGSTDSLGTDGVVTVRVITDSIHSTDEGDPLSWLYGVAITEDALSFDDYVAEPDATSPLDFHRSITSSTSMTDVMAPTVVGPPPPQVRAFSDQGQPTDFVVYDHIIRVIHRRNPYERPTHGRRYQRSLDAD